MGRKVFIAILAFIAIGANAQEKKSVELPTWLNNVKLSGYGMLQYQAMDKEDAEENSFQLRLARISLDGRIANDWYWKAQIQFNGNTTTLGSSPRVVDLFAEWQKLPYLNIKAGQFKRPFTFENPMHPIDQGFMSYSQNISALAGFSDRTGMHASNGRDIGVQLQGDLVKNENGRYLVHYQVGIFNGQGINTKDVDQQKDLIGGAWVMPVKGMRLGVFGWTGSYARKGTSASEGITTNTLRKLQQRRYAISGEYKFNDWTIRSEYIHSTGYAFKTRYQKESDAKDITLANNGNKADGIYALCIAPIKSKKLYAKARYDMYRSNAEWNSAKTYYEVGLNYLFHKNLQINAEYARVNDRTAQKHDYNMVDVELDFRF